MSEIGEWLTQEDRGLATGAYMRATGTVRGADRLLAIVEAAHDRWAHRLTQVDVVFTGPPGPESGRFVEVENTDGRSLRVGDWLERDDGARVLRLTVLRPEDPPQ